MKESVREQVKTSERKIKAKLEKTERMFIVRLGSGISKSKKMQWVAGIGQR